MGLGGAVSPPTPLMDALVQWTSCTPVPAGPDLIKIRQRIREGTIFPREIARMGRDAHPSYVEWRF